MEYGFKTLELVLLTALRTQKYFNPHDIQEIIDILEDGLGDEVSEEVYKLHRELWEM